MAEPLQDIQKWPQGEHFSLVQNSDPENYFTAARFKGESTPTSAAAGLNTMSRLFLMVRTDLNYRPIGALPIVLSLSTKLIPSLN